MDQQRERKASLVSELYWETSTFSADCQLIEQNYLIISIEPLHISSAWHSNKI